MKFRPCIDIHDGMVKQIVGGSLKDEKGLTRENFVSKRDASYYAKMYKEDGLGGGHIILLNPAKSPEYEMDLKQAETALREYPDALQIGGGITDANAELMLKLGASHVIVTSYVFHDGIMDEGRLLKLNSAVGRENLVLDLSCRRTKGAYYIVTDRWQKFTNVRISVKLLEELSQYCDEYLIHGVDVEGKRAGIDSELVSLLSGYEGNPVTYAGGVGTIEDIERIRILGRDRIDVTVGSALDLFGGNLSYKEVVKRYAHI